MTFDTGDTAWVLTAAAVVLFMTPGLALFYAGMVRAKHALAMLMQNVFAMGLITVLWVLVGCSLAFGTDVGGAGLLGGLDLVGLRGLVDAPVPGFEALTIPPLLFVGYQMMFAVITPALITGATADRLRFGAYAAFVGAWSLVVYAPVAHWVFSPSGWLYRLGALDFAGGTVVHVNAGAAALALVLVVGRRRGVAGEAMPAHSLPLTLLGTGILWFGWFGFNAGSALGANAVAAVALVNTQVAAAAGMLGWLALERARTGSATTLGAASGAVAGLVAITPAAAFVGPLAAIAIGAAAGGLCLLGVRLKHRFRYDDALDVVGVHLVGGVVGSLLLGVFAQRTSLGVGADGLLFGGGVALLGRQLVAVAATFAYAFGMSLILAKAVDAVVGLRVPADDELAGLDVSLHGERAYHDTDASTGRAAPVASMAVPSKE